MESHEVNLENMYEQDSTYMLYVAVARTFRAAVWTQPLGCWLFGREDVK